jgi:hypothetical protein
LLAVGELVVLVAMVATVEHQAAATAILRQLLLIRAKVALAQVNQQAGPEAAVVLIVELIMDQQAHWVLAAVAVAQLSVMDGTALVAVAVTTAVAVVASVVTVALAVAVQVGLVRHYLVSSLTHWPQQ